ncbi:hypothetical protein Scep_016907 [Stephania cephalantha]|uniref:Uncharacterized protein n=1 Tax=Stephania cephalantha TaxID=152367 RepID=A0AAP0ING8_9MAGN
MAVARHGVALSGRSILDETTTVDKAAGRQVSHPEPEFAGLLSRLNELLVGNGTVLSPKGHCYRWGRAAINEDAPLLARPNQHRGGAGATMVQ